MKNARKTGDKETKIVIKLAVLTGKLSPGQKQLKLEFELGIKKET